MAGGPAQTSIKATLSHLIRDERCRCAMDCLRQLCGMRQLMMPDSASLCWHVNRCWMARLPCWVEDQPFCKVLPGHLTEARCPQSNALPDEHGVHRVLSYSSRASFARGSGQKVPLRLEDQLGIDHAEEAV